MKNLFTTLSQSNPVLFYFGVASLIGTLFCALLIIRIDTQVLGINAYIKPFKFFLSTVIFVWSMNLFMSYLQPSWIISSYSWIVIVVLAFELIWITYQASQGQTPHFNVKTPFNSLMWSLMGGSIFIMTICTLGIAVLFFTNSVVADLPASYLWGIRLGIIFFVIFAMEGGAMGARMAHTVGGADGGAGLPLVNWSTRYGDLRIAHFLGMHALQILPLMGLLVLKRPVFLISFAGLFFVAVSAVMIQALRGKPLIPMS